MPPNPPGTDPLALTVDDLGALLEACYFQAAVRLAMRVPLQQPVQVALIGATTSRILDPGTGEPGVLWLLGGLEATPLPAEAWNPRNRLRP